MNFDQVIQGLVTNNQAIFDAKTNGHYENFHALIYANFTFSFPMPLLSPNLGN